MDGYVQELQHIAHMEFIQYWRDAERFMAESEKDYFKNLYCAAFISGAIASQKLTVMSFDSIKGRLDAEEKEAEDEKGV